MLFVNECNVLLSPQRIEQVRMQWSHGACALKVEELTSLTAGRSRKLFSVQMGVDVARSNNLHVRIDMTFPALPCHGELQPSADALCHMHASLDSVACAHKQLREGASGRRWVACAARLLQPDGILRNCLMSGLLRKDWLCMQL